MADLNLEEFERQIRKICASSSIVENIILFAPTETSNLWRVTLIDNSFVDVYYSETKSKTSFAHIRNEKRIFGADNAGGWHWHPVESPDSHVVSEAEITFGEFLKKLEESFK